MEPLYEDPEISQAVTNLNAVFRARGFSTASTYGSEPQDYRFLAWKCDCRTADCPHIPK